MGKLVSAGTFPAHNNTFEIEKSADTFVAIKGIEEYTPSFDSNIEKYFTYDNEGWQSADKTGMAWGISCKGKRIVGDDGNDLIAGKVLNMGADAKVNFRWTQPDGTRITGQMVIDPKNLAAGKTTDVGALEFDLVSDGKPEITKVESLTTQS